jgi:RNA polymerase sigma-70 factor (ECF subfamily)
MTRNVFERLCAARELKTRIADRRGRLYRVAYAWCGERHLADDLVQETLTRALGKCHQLEDASRLDGWLYSILNNCWKEYLRGRKPHAELDEALLECTRCPERASLADELTRRVTDLMDRLPVGQRQVLSLVALEDLSYREVAEALDIPMGTVMSRLSRARQFLAERLGSTARPVEAPRVYLRRVK